MANGVWKGIWVFGRSKQLLPNKFFDPSTPSMRKGCDGEKRGGKTTDENSGHYVIASSRPQECRPLERITLAPIGHTILQCIVFIVTFLVQILLLFFVMFTFCMRKIELS